jgi:hypothetical protein
MGRIVELEGKIEIPIKVDLLLAQFYPELGFWRRLYYISVFRFFMVFGKRIELWKK